MPWLWPGRGAADEFSRAFQRTVGAVHKSASRERRLNSGVAHTTRGVNHAYPALKRRAKVNSPLRGRIEQHAIFITT